MSNLMYLARSGLSAGQSALNIIGNNLVNATTPGYNRRNIMLGENGGLSTSVGFYGYGAKVDGVQRSYDAFINTQVRGALSSYSNSTVRYQSLSGIDNLFADVTNNVSTTLSDVFEGLTGLQGKPDDGPGRTNVLAQFRTLANQFNTRGKALDEELKSNTTNIKNTVDDINNMTSSLAKLNQDIARIQATSGTAPADLLDQRDTLLENLSQQINITVNESPNGVVNVKLQNGTQLVGDDGASKLSTQQDPGDPTRLVLMCEDPTGKGQKLNSSIVSGGALAGYLKYRNEDLVDVRNQLNDIALQMANAFNEVNQKGFDKNGNAGKPIYGFTPPKVKPNADNTGTSQPTMSYSDISQVKSQNYNITFKNGAWEVTTEDGSKVNATMNGGKLEFDGVSVDVGSGAAEGDTFQLNPTEGIASSITMDLDNADEIALADNTGGTGNDANLQGFLDLKNKKLVNGSTISDAYGSLVSTIGSRTSEAKNDSERDTGIVSSYAQQKQSMVGVDLNEEYINMQMYQQYYQANTQMLNTANTLFDSILRAVG